MPSNTPSMWVPIGNPAEEWPVWTESLGAYDAYIKGDKVSHNGGFWISEIDSNIWEPGVYGWMEAVK